MPYLQIVLEKDLNAAEAQLALTYIRDHFPLHQSEGHLLRMTSSFLLFEQPEHEVLTLEQELWLERHTKEAHIWDISFYHGYAKGCRLCDHPFDDSPTGYCSQCHRTNPFQTASLRFPLTKVEDAYVTYLARHVWGRIEDSYLRLIVMTFLDLLEAGHITMEKILSSGPTDFEGKARALYQKQQTTCPYCGLPDEQCTCEYPPLRHHDNHFAFEREYFAMLPLLHQDARHLQELAERHGLTVDVLVRILIDFPDIQIAAASREAAAGHVFCTNFAFQLAQIAEQGTQGFLQNGPISAIGDVDGNTFSMNPFQFTVRGTLIAGALPLLETRVPALLFGQTLMDEGERSFRWVQEQLAACDALAAQKAQPCTPEEIAKLEVLAGGHFPSMYQTFLAWMGHGAGAFLKYLPCFYSDLPGLQTAARALLVTDGCQEQLPVDAWVIAFAGGQHFTFFRLSEGEDPPVYAYRSEWRRTPFCKIAHHVSDFLSIQVALYAEYRQHGSFQSPYEKRQQERFLAIAPHIEGAMAEQQFAKEN